MKKLSKEVLIDAGKRLMFDIDEKECDLLLEEFEILTKQFELLDEIDNLDNISPMTFPYLVFNNYLRDDIPENALTKEEVLKNAGSVQDGQIKLPKVV